ncbi:MAG: hypothetical protein WC924_01170 [Candidatus Gracilibacteria bacterium]
MMLLNKQKHEYYSRIVEAEKLLYEIRFEDGLICPRCEGKEVTIDSYWSFRCRACRNSCRISRFGLFTGTALGDTKLKPRIILNLVAKYLSGSRVQDDFDELKAGCSNRSFYSFLRKIDGTLSSRFFAAEGIKEEDIKGCKKFCFKLDLWKIQICNKNEAEVIVASKQLELLETAQLPLIMSNFFYDHLENSLVMGMKDKAYFKYLFSWVYLYNIGLANEVSEGVKLRKILKELLKVEKT